MEKRFSKWKVDLPLVVWIIVFIAWFTYAYLVFQVPTVLYNQKFWLYSLSMLSIRNTTIVASIIAWSFGVFAWQRVRAYGDSLKGNADTRAIDYMQRGIAILLGSMVVAALISSMRSHYLNELELARFLTIVLNYFYAIIPAVGFYFLWKSGQLLSIQTVDRPKKHSLPVLLLGIAFFVMYSVVIVTNQNRQIPFASNVLAAYNLSDALIILTIIFPAMTGWVFGWLAASRIVNYGKQVRGIVFQAAFRRLGYGCMLLIISSMLLQAAISFGSEHLLLRRLGPAFVVVVAYLFLIMEVVGYGFLAAGARQLKRIETV